MGLISRRARGLRAKIPTGNTELARCQTGRAAMKYLLDTSVWLCLFPDS